MMVTLSKKSFAIACILCFAVGWQLHQQSVPQPNTDRPVLRALARIAKTALWFMAFAEPAPSGPNVEVQSVLTDEDGYVHINHARGW